MYSARNRGWSAHFCKLRGDLYIPAYPLGVMHSMVRLPQKARITNLLRTVDAVTVTVPGRSSASTVIGQPNYGHRPPRKRHNKRQIAKDTHG